MTKAADDLKVMWERVMARLRAQIGDEIVSSWFSRMEVESLEAGSVSLSVPTKFLKSWTSSRYGDRLLSLWQLEEKKVTRIEIRVRQPGEAAVAKRAQAQANRADPASVAPDLAMACRVASASAANGPGSQAGGSGRERGTPLDARLTFDTFIVGRSNALAHAAAGRVTSARPGSGIEFNPLYIHGPVGVGKTHILNAMAWDIRRQNLGRKVMLLSAVRFMAGFVEALKARDVHGFKQSFADIDVLLIDDIQFLRGDKVQQEFCHIFNMAEAAGKQIVIAGDMAPSRLETLEERIRSRLSGGLAAPIGPVDPEMRRGILDARAKHLITSGQAAEIPSEVLNFIARRVQGSGRDLEGVLNQLVAQEKVGPTPITIDAAAAVIRDIVAETPARQIMIEDVLRAVTGHFNVSRADLLSSRRHKSIVYPRQVGMYLAKTLTTRSLPEIGRKFGGRDHTTVLHAVRKIERLVGEDVGVRNSVDVLRNVLRD
ncbi:Chromosomal replication initiator protein DnaA [hydrothermal vent metagenome]|uniref:Chromosomal replication initiator protein DnaA n=1 Tax=hydrothermal vent metagenome TaxID=652676 RepID=A0A3B0SW69_9ZZZZ